MTDSTIENARSLVTQIKADMDNQGSDTVKVTRNTIEAIDKALQALKMGV